MSNQHERTEWFDDSVVDVAIHIMDSQIGAFNNVKGLTSRSNFIAQGPIRETRRTLIRDILLIGTAADSEIVRRAFLEPRLKSETLVATNAEQIAHGAGNSLEEQEAFKYGLLLRIAIEQINRPLTDIRAERRLEARDLTAKDLLDENKGLSSIFTGFTSVVGLLTTLLTAVAGFVLAVKGFGKPSIATPTKNEKEVSD